MRKKVFQYFLMMICCVVLTTVVFPSQAAAQRDRDRDRDDRNRYEDDNDRRYQQHYTKSQVAEIIKRVEENSNRFRQDLDRDLDKGRLDGSRREDQINEDVKAFENAFNNLRREFDRNDNWWESRNHVQTALDSARPVATRLRNNQFSSNVQNQWSNLRVELNKLAFTYNLPPENDTSRRYGDRNRYEDRNGNNDRSGYEDRRYQQRYTKNQVSTIIRQVEENSNRFRRDLDRDLDRSRIDGSRREEQINEDVRAFENAFNNLRREFNSNNSWWESRNNVQTAIDSARPVETRLRNNQFSRTVQNQWRNLRISLNKLASTYNLPAM